MAFTGLGSVREFAPLYDFTLWFDDGVLIERLTWLKQYLSADGIFGGEMDVSLTLVGLPLYEWPISLRTSDVALRVSGGLQVYRRAMFLQSYFHVRRPPADRQSIVGLCYKWLVREDWEPAYTAEIANNLRWLEQQDLPDLDGPAIEPDIDVLCFPPLLDVGFRAEVWTT